jgi:hypothetical protein
MNPNSSAAVASRAAFFSELVERQRRLRGAAAAPGATGEALHAAKVAETDVRANLSRMRAMGDPEPSAGHPAATIVQIAPAPAARPTASAAVGPSEAIAARIVVSAALAEGWRGPVDDVEAVAARILESDRITSGVDEVEALAAQIVSSAALGAASTGQELDTETSVDAVAARIAASDGNAE